LHFDTATAQMIPPMWAFWGARVRSILRVAGGLFGAAIATLSAQAQAPAEGPTTTQLPAFVAPNPAAGPLWGYLWGGVGSTNTFYGGYAGAMVALNGNLYSNGVIVRADWAAGRYSHKTATFPDSHVNTDGGSLMIGYRGAIGPGWITGYIGPSYEAHHQADPTSALSGQLGGVKIVTEYMTTIGQSMNLYSSLSYNTPFQTVFFLAKPTYRLTESLSIGPQFSAGSGTEGNSYGNWRIGPVLDISTPYYDISISGGLLQQTRGPDGYYAGVFLGIPFRR
jgi:hypothetical protein